MTARPFLDADREEALAFRERMIARYRGEHRPPKLPRRKRPKLDGATHLVIGDAHVTPEHDNRRFDWLGKMIADLRPDVVIDIGDSCSFDSLCHYEQGRKTFQSKRFHADVEAYLDAKERIGQHLPKKRPRLVKCDGNHENRVNKFISYEPRFEGIINLEMLRDEEMGWERHPFLERAVVDGMTYIHYAKQLGVTDRPVGGVSPARSSLIKYHTPMVTGHTHKWGYHAEPDGHSGMIQAFNAGCYFEHDEDYAGSDVDLWTRGILELRGVKRGRVRSWRWHDIREIEATYG